MRHIAIASVCALTLLSGCGDDDGASSGRGGPAPAPPAVDVTVTVHPDGPNGPVRTRRVVCERPGRGSRTCRGLSARRLAPVPPNTPCTAIYGGPGVARVTGTIRGERVDARFNLEDGCEIARWQRNRRLLGPPNS